MINMNVKEFKMKNEKKKGFGFNNGPLNLNNGCNKSNQFCKLLN